MTEQEADARIRVGDLYDSTVELCRFFNALKVAGFTPGEALYLTGQVLTAKMKGQQHET